MKICSVRFGGYTGDKYTRLMNAFKKSCSENMPGVLFDEIVLPDQSRDYHLTWVQQSNTIKLKKWAEYVMLSKQTVCLADCDMLAVGDARKIDQYDFDIAYAVNNKSKTPMNGGIIFAKPTAAARNFMVTWVDNNKIILETPSEFHKYSRWQGQNQRAFGRMMDKGYPECKLLKLDPIVWNATDFFWDKINDETIFIHIKAELRKLVLDNKKPDGIYEKAMNEWYKYADVNLEELQKKWKIEKQRPRVPNTWA